MERASLARREPTGRTGLLLWAAGLVFELPVVAAAVSSFPDVAAEAVFGSAGSQVVAFAALALVVAGVAVAWLGSGGSGLRRGLAVLLWITSGLLAVLMAGFLTGGAWVVFAVLLAHSTAAVAVIGWLLARRGAVTAR